MTSHDDSRSNHQPHYHQVTDAQRAHQRSRGTRNLVLGALWCLAGLLITVVTLANEPHSGFYVVALGPIIGGIAQMVSGARSYSRGTS